MDEPQDVVQRCLELFQGGRPREAAALAESELRRSPDDGELWQLFGLLRQRAGDLDGARVALETANTLVPLAPSARSMSSRSNSCVSTPERTAT